MSLTGKMDIDLFARLKEGSDSNDRLYIYRSDFSEVGSKYWFKAAHVCKLLGYRNQTEATRNHLKPTEWTWFTREFQNGSQTGYKGVGGRPPLYISLAGFIRLAMRSKTPIAREFQDWLVHFALAELDDRDLKASLTSLKTEKSQQASHGNSATGKH